MSEPVTVERRRRTFYFEWRTQRPPHHPPNSWRASVGRWETFEECDAAVCDWLLAFPAGPHGRVIETRIQEQWTKDTRR